MALLIDGYNLLHVTAIVGHGGLRGSREGLLRFLASAIDPRERPQTTIVFDAAEAPPHLPRMIVVDEMTIHFSSEYDNADELIEELIEAHSVPKSLLVVSSDHRIQRAARRRKAPFVDSDVWFADARTGYAVGAYNLIVRTADGGKTWESWFDRTDNPKFFNLYAIAQVSGDVYVAGEGGVVLKLDAAAQRFRALSTGYNGSFFGVADAGSARSWCSSARRSSRT